MEHFLHTFFTQGPTDAHRTQEREHRAAAIAGVRPRRVRVPPGLHSVVAAREMLPNDPTRGGHAQLHQLPGTGIEYPPPPRFNTLANPACGSIVVGYRPTCSPPTSPPSPVRPPHGRCVARGIARWRWRRTMRKRSRCSICWRRAGCSARGWDCTTLAPPLHRGKLPRCFPR